MRSLSTSGSVGALGAKFPGATRGLEEQRGERAIALSIALGQLSLKVGVDAVKIFQRSMDPRVVEVLYADV